MRDWPEALIRTHAQCVLPRCSLGHILHSCCRVERRRPPLGRIEDSRKSRNLRCSLFFPRRPTLNYKFVMFTRLTLLKHQYGDNVKGLVFFFRLNFRTPLISAFRAYISKTARWNFFILLTFDKHDKTQLLAKFKKILYMGIRATLNFRKFKVALNPMYRIFLNFAKSCILSCLSKFDTNKKFHRAVYKIKALKAEIKGVFSRS